MAGPFFAVAAVAAILRLLLSVLAAVESSAEGTRGWEDAAGARLTVE